MIAKIEQLGVFEIFFTLSCADKRWEEIFISILCQQGHDVLIQKASGQAEILVDGEPLQEVMKRENTHQVLRDNVYTITKVFDKRIQNFINHIICGKNSPMNVSHFQYRIEFQARGAGHAHGVLWLDLNSLEDDFPGIAGIFKNLKLNEPFAVEQTETLKKFIDQFITCSLDNDEVRTIVKEVQSHHHTKTCRKYGKKCRFNFPRFPSKETIIAQPLSRTHFDSDKAFKERKKKLKKTLEKVKDVIDCFDDQRSSRDQPIEEGVLDNLTIGDILKKAKVTETDYYEALKVSETGKVVILKRSPKEMWTNNYNAEWIEAWNGNMDIQICLDFFAIVTYITGNRLFKMIVSKHTNFPKMVQFYVPLF